eukprot:scaffold109973_cov48-Prasinocladus_malaysianus.AAC.1
MSRKAALSSMSHLWMASVTCGAGPGSAQILSSARLSSLISASAAQAVKPVVPPPLIHQGGPNTVLDESIQPYSDPSFHLIITA